MLKYIWNSVSCNLDLAPKKNTFRNVVDSAYVGACPSILHIDRDENRIPRYITTYHCGDCKNKSCYGEPGFKCQQITDRRTVKVKKGNKYSKESKPFPVACICVSQNSTLLRHITESYP